MNPTVLVTMAVLWGPVKKRNLGIIKDGAFSQPHTQACEGECKVWLSRGLGLKGAWVFVLISATLTATEDENFHPKKWHVTVQSLDIPFYVLQTLTQNVSPAVLGMPAILRAFGGLVMKLRIEK